MPWLIIGLVITVVVIGVVRTRAESVTRKSIIAFRQAMYPYFLLGQRETVRRFAQPQANSDSVDPTQPISPEEFTDILAAQHFRHAQVEPARDWLLLGAPPRRPEPDIPAEPTVVD